METLAAWQPRMLSVLRMVSGFIFLLHGTKKHFGIPPTDRLVDAFALTWFAGAIEIVCGFAILVGFFTRPAAFLAAFSGAKDDHQRVLFLSIALRTALCVRFSPKTCVTRSRSSSLLFLTTRCTV